MVTIFGQSAGAASVHLHMLSPLSKGKVLKLFTLEEYCVIFIARDVFAKRKCLQSASDNKLLSFNYIQSFKRFKNPDLEIITILKVMIFFFRFIPSSYQPKWNCSLAMGHHTPNVGQKSNKCSRHINRVSSEFDRNAC